MKKSELIAVVCLSGVLMSGCISTTTGSPAPEADAADASELNYQLGARYYQNGKSSFAGRAITRAREDTSRRRRATPRTTMPSGP